MKKYFDGYLIAFVLIGMGLFLFTKAPTYVQHAEAAEQSASKATVVAFAKYKEEPNSAEYLELVKAEALASANFYRAVVSAMEWFAVFLIIVGAIQVRFVFKLQRSN